MRPDGPQRRHRSELKYQRFADTGIVLNKLIPDQLTVTDALLDSSVIGVHYPPLTSLACFHERFVNSELVMLICFDMMLYTGIIDLKGGDCHRFSRSFTDRADRWQLSSPRTRGRPTIVGFLMRGYAGPSRE